MDVKHWRLRVINFYPPFLGAGVRVRPIADGFEVHLRMRWWNRNYVGTHFGGSLFSMCDPFFMLILARALGPDYVVWDKAASIRFRRPGRGTVHARLTIDSGRIAEIRGEADRSGKTEPRFVANVIGPDGEIVAEIEKVVHVRRRDRQAAGAAASGAASTAAGAAAPTP